MHEWQTENWLSQRQHEGGGVVVQSGLKMQQLYAAQSNINNTPYEICQLDA